MRPIILTLAAACLAGSALAAETAAERLRDATDVLNEIMAAPDKGIPQDLLEKAHCIVIVPSMKKAAFVVGGEFGKGFVLCRRTVGWGAPAAVRVEGGSVGLQIGASGTDVILLIMNPRGMNELMKSKFTLGADASVAAGPVGRMASAQTGALMTAEILAWSRSKGLFAGVALDGATLRPDMDANRELYGSRLDTREVTLSDTAPPAAAGGLMDALNRYAMRK